MNKLTSSNNAVTPPPIRPEGSRRTNVGDLARSLLGELLILAVCAVFWVQTYKFEQADADGLGPTFMPRLLIGLLALCVLIRIAQTVHAARWAPASARPRGAKEAGPSAEHADEENHPTSPRHMLVGIAVAVGYVLATTYLGYPIATFLLIIAFVATTSRLTWKTFAVAFGVALFFPYLFVKIVYIDLPTGVGVFDSLTIALYSLLGIY